MDRARRPISLALLVTAACGNDHASSPDAAPAPPDALAAATCDEDTLPTSLAALPAVTAATETACGDYVVQPARCFAIEVAQPVDHAAPDGATFPQHLFLIHRGCERPTLVADWGYANSDFYDFELSVLYQTNALWIEHRFQGASVPDTADWDWSALTIANGAGDVHRVIDTFRAFYDGRWVSTGASKGGITALYHAYFFPDDLDGSIPYVAPASRARVDPAYQDYLADALPTDCAGRLRDLQVAALTTRRTMMIDRLTDVTGPGGEEDALEMLTASIDWGFWQAWGESYCDDVPDADATDDAFWDFYLDFSYLGFASPGAPDETTTLNALSYEWLTEQGFALQINDAVAPLLESSFATATMEDRFRASFPDVELPPHDPSTTAAVRTWVRDDARDLLLIYGQYDPWSGGMIDTPSQSSSARFIVPGATHAAQIGALPDADRTAALAIATRLFGTEPVESFGGAAARAGADHQRRLARRLLRDLATPLRLHLRRQSLLR